MAALLRQLMRLLAFGMLRRRARRMVRATALMALAALFGMLGLAGFALAGFILLARVMDPVVAALLIGALCCLAGGLCLLLARAQMRWAPDEEAVKIAGQEQARLRAAVGPGGIVVPLVLAALGGFILTSRRK